MSSVENTSTNTSVDVHDFTEDVFELEDVESSAEDLETFIEECLSARVVESFDKESSNSNVNESHTITTTVNSSSHNNEQQEENIHDFLCRTGYQRDGFAKAHVQAVSGCVSIFSKPMQDYIRKTKLKFNPQDASWHRGIIKYILNPEKFLASNPKYRVDDSIIEQGETLGLFSKEQVMYLTSSKGNSMYPSDGFFHEKIRQLVTAVKSKKMSFSTKNTRVMHPFDYDPKFNMAILFMKTHK